MLQNFKMAFRDLGRNRRRSFFSALALSVGLAILILMASVINGEIGGAFDSAIRLQTGHIQVRAASYDANKSSLKWQDLVQKPDQIAAQIAALPQVKAATPRLFASGFLSTVNESSGVQVYGIDPTSVANDPYRTGIISGSYLTADDSEGLLIGQPVALKLHLKAGDTVGLSVNTANGTVEEQTFTVRGIYTTGTYAFDNSTILLPLAKAQTITQTQNHASTIFVLLKDASYTDSVANALKGPGLTVLTWKQMNSLIVDFESLAQSYISIFYLIVLAIAASVIINTLIMSVYERTREIGILSAVGMRGSRIMMLFLTESFLLAVGGVLMGVLLGWLFTFLFNIHGFYIGKMGLTGMMVADTIFARVKLSDFINLSILTFIISILAGLYPAIMASRLQPVEALRAEK
ncbi:MAG TPA: ABC transporter permease [Anaerolineales bacterium]|nr:ABC transporter permease [Anaerolineales bacterium]